MVPGGNLYPLLGIRMTDFGKVLADWEKLDHHTSRTSVKKEHIEEDDHASRARKALEEAMMSGDLPVPKDEVANTSRPLTKADIAAMPVEAVLDLHGVTAADAEVSLAAFFRDAAVRGVRKVLVIHGKGLHSEEEPVLGKTVRHFLETSPYAGRNGTADRRSGGSGAVWVLIKGSISARGR
jgi:DNA-nicking Smr family endonuclease